MKNPYKELSPYIESDARSFKGRSVEISEMYESFDRNDYLVCHADSGEGKSSIIEAGLIPRMKANCFFPIRIIFKSDEHFKNNNINFDEVICGIIHNEIEKIKCNKNFSVAVIYPKRLTINDEKGLNQWEKTLINSYAWLKLRYTRITIDNLIYTPVLIFDQFEEFFTNPQSQDWTDQFFAWVQELSMDLCPQRIIKALERHINDEEFPEISTKKCYKAIFSLRSEYVGKLDYWGLQRHYIPLLKNNRYLLRPLTMKGAKEVITQQDGYDGLNSVADKIIETLRELQKGKNYVMEEVSDLPCIPALFLSIICSRAFTMSNEKRTSFMQKLVVDNDEDKKIAIYSLIEGFYNKAIEECEIPSKDMDVIEDVLVNNEGSRQRVSSQADALKTIAFSEKYLEKLKRARLIRVIPEYNREDDCVEFVHDALCPIIQKKKELRMAAKNKAREEQLLLEQGKKIQKLKRRIALGLLIAIGAIAIAVWVFTTITGQRDSLKKALIAENNALQEANTARLEADIARMDAENATKEKENIIKELEDKNETLSQLNAQLMKEKENVRLANWDRMGIRSKLIALAGEEIIDEDPDMAFIAALYALPENTSNPAYPMTSEAERLLRLSARKSEIIYEGIDVKNAIATISSDGKYLAALDKDSIVIWEISSGIVLKTIKYSGTYSCLSMDYSHDGKYLILNDGYQISIWDVEKGNQIEVINEAKYTKGSIMFCPDGGSFIINRGFLTPTLLRDVNRNRKKDNACISLKGHTKSVNSVSFSSDSTMLVSASNDSTIIIWNASNGSPIRTLVGHTGEVNDATFSPDGNYIVSVSNDSTVRVWEVSSGKTIREFKGHNGKVSSAFFSPNGDYVASVSNNRTIIWRPFTGESIYTLYTKVTNTCAFFSPDSKCIVEIYKRNSIRIGRFIEEGTIFKPFMADYDTVIMPFGINMKTGKLFFNLPRFGIGMWDKEKNNTEYPYLRTNYNAQMSSDGEYLLGNNNFSFSIWNTKNKKMETYFAHGKDLSIVSFTPNCRQIISGHENGNISIWDIGSDIPNIIFKGHKDQINCLSYSHNGKFIATASLDKTIKLWDANTYREIGFPMKHNEYIHSIAFIPNSDKLLSISDSFIYIWDTSTCQENKRFPIQEKFNNLSIKPDGTEIAYSVCDNDCNYVAIIDMKTGIQTKTLNEDFYGEIPISYSPDGTLFATSSLNHSQIHIYETKTWGIIDTLKASQNNGFTSVSFNQNGDKIIASSWLNGVFVWDLKNKKPIRFDNSSYSVYYSPDGSRVASFTGDWTLHIWDTEPFKLITKINCSTPVYFSNNNKFVASVNYSTIRIIEANTGQVICTLDSKGCRINSIIFSPDDLNLLAACDDGLIRIWEITTGIKNEITAHDKSIYSIAFSKNGKYFVSVGEDRRIKFWDATSMKSYKTVYTDNKFHHVSFSPDGKYFLTSDNEIISIRDARTGKEVDRRNGHYPAYFSADGKYIYVSNNDKINIYDFPDLQALIQDSRKRVKNRQLTSEERKRLFID